MTTAVRVFGVLAFTGMGWIIAGAMFSLSENITAPTCP